MAPAPNASTNLAAAIDAYNDKVQQAEDTYAETARSVTALTRQNLEDSRATLMTAIRAILKDFEDAIKGARESYQNSTRNATSSAACNQQLAAWNTYARAVHTAGKSRDRATAATQHAFDVAVSAIVRDHHLQKAAAVRTRDEAISEAILQLDLAVAQFDTETRRSGIGGSLSAEMDRALRDRQAAWSAADALQAYHDDVARAERNYAVAAATATNIQAKVAADAKASALAAWHSAEQTAWSAYQLAVARNAAKAAGQLADAERDRAIAVAAATLGRSVRRNEVARNYSREVATLQSEEAEAVATAKHDYWRNVAAERLLALEQAATARRDMRNELAAYHEAHAAEVALGGERLALESSEATRDFQPGGSRLAHAGRSDRILLNGLRIHFLHLHSQCSS